MYKRKATALFILVEAVRIFSFMPTALTVGKERDAWRRLGQDRRRRPHQHGGRGRGRWRRVELLRAELLIEALGPRLGDVALVFRLSID